jgi:hypothetical protein
VLDAPHWLLTPHDLNGKLAVLTVDCGKCDRSGRYLVATLVRLIGADPPTARAGLGATSQRCAPLAARPFRRSERLQLRVAEPGLSARSCSAMPRKPCREGNRGMSNGEQVSRVWGWRCEPDGRSEIGQRYCQRHIRNADRGSQPAVLPDTRVNHNEGLNITDADSRL